MQNKESERVYEGFFVRLAAFIVDSLIVGAGLLVIKIPMWFASFGTDNLLQKDFIFQYSVLDIVYYVLGVCYFALLTYFTGATLGKRLFHLRVISSEDRKPTFFEIVFRESVGRFLSRLIVFVGYIMVGADKKKRGLHDILSDTHVIYEHKVTLAVPTPVLVRQIPYGVPNSGQNQFMPGNGVPNPGQNQFMLGNGVPNPGQNQFVPSGDLPETSGQDQGSESDEFENNMTE